MLPSVVAGGNTAPLPMPGVVLPTDPNGQVVATSAGTSGYPRPRHRRIPSASSGLAVEIPQGASGSEDGSQLSSSVGRRSTGSIYVCFKPISEKEEGGVGSGGDALMDGVGGVWRELPVNEI